VSAPTVPQPPEPALSDIFALRDGTAFSVIGTRAHEYAFRGNPHVPVTVAWGARDRVLLHRQAALARHVALPCCGHVPMSDAPTQVAPAILATTKEERA
jgi:pimeloyl-ACP methyl ester carboxylesterase